MHELDRTPWGRVQMMEHVGRIGPTVGRILDLAALKDVTPAMAADLRAFEQRGLSPDERRKAIIKKYGKTHA